MGMNITSNRPADDTIYRSPDGQRWRIVGEENDREMVRVKDGHRMLVSKDLVEESIWLKQHKK